MDGIRSYLGSVIAVCLLATLAMALVRQERAHGLVRLISGLLVVLVVLRPLPTVDWTELTEGLLSIGGSEVDRESFQQKYQDSLRQNIRTNTQRYIEERAAAMGVYLQAEVELSDDEYPVPVAVRLVGIVNHDQWMELSLFLKDSLGIPVEKQEWTMDEAN